MNIFDHTTTYFADVCPRNYTNVANTSDSISSLLTIPLTQSQCIKFGTHIEKILCTFIASYSHVENIRPQNRKGQSERDHLFRFSDGRKLYAELKCNLNLDTEKRKKTQEKVNKISNEEGCDGYLLAVRYLNEVPERIRKEYNAVKVLSVSEYFKLVDVPCPFGDSVDMYTTWLNQIAKELVCRDEDLDVRIQRLESDIQKLTALKVQTI
jgi:hypothetical protein